MQSGKMYSVEEVDAILKKKYLNKHLKQHHPKRLN